MRKILLTKDYTAQEVADLAGCEYSLVDRYDRVYRIVRPSVLAGHGSGRHRARRYSFEDVVCMAVAVRLRRVGMKPARIKKAVKLMRDDPQLQQKWLVSDGDRVYLRNDDGSLVDLLKARQLAIALFLEPLHRIR